jgi:hypothetical protein
MGYFAKNGSYVIDWKKVRTYVVPENLNEFKVYHITVRSYMCFEANRRPAHPVRHESHGPHKEQIHPRD